MPPASADGGPRPRRSRSPQHARRASRRYAGIENHSDHYSTPKELLNIGVVNIYNEDENIVFLYSSHDNIPLGYGQGIIYIQHKELVPHWRILNNISDQWYYFIDPSL